MIGQILRGVGGILNPAKRLAEVFVPNAERQAGRNFSDSRSAREQFADEFGSDRTWWDSLINGLNRLPRPIMVFMVITYFYLSFGNPTLFQKINGGLETIPDHMWYICLGIVGFYFPLRTTEKLMKRRRPQVIQGPPGPQGADGKGYSITGGIITDGDGKPIGKAFDGVQHGEGG